VAGFHFVTTHELTGLSKDQIMPQLPTDHPAEKVTASLWLVSVRIVAWLGAAVSLIAIVTAILGMVRLSLIAIGALVHDRRRRSSAATSVMPFKGTIAVVVPAHDEETVICKTIWGLLSSTIGHRLQVIVVDDGSKDRTSEVVRTAFAADDRVKLYRKENGGKAEAMNLGIARSDAEIIVAIDGDTVLSTDAIERLTAHFNDPSIGAVAGKVVVGNQVNLLTRFQALEYVTSQNLDRRAFELFNAIGVVPGAIGAWRRQAVLEIGGFSADTLAEDADLTVSLERHGWRVISEPSAEALTEAPETLRAFMRQRFRWTFGTLQVAFKHAGALLQGPSGVSLITIPNVVLFQFGFAILTPMMDLMLLVSLAFEVAALLELVQPQGDALILIAQYWLLFQAVDLLTAVVALMLNKDRLRWTLLPLLVLQRFTYRQLLYLAAIRAVLAAAKGGLVGWGKLVRTGNVAIPLRQLEVSNTSI
jgi:peptidoglycan-N-acetylglucosamine deacetylase